MANRLYILQDERQGGARLRGQHLITLLSRRLRHLWPQHGPNHQIHHHHHFQQHETSYTLYPHPSIPNSQ